MGLEGQSSKPGSSEMDEIKRSIDLYNKDIFDMDETPQVNKLAILKKENYHFIYINKQPNSHQYFYFCRLRLKILTNTLQGQRVQGK